MSTKLSLTLASQNIQSGRGRESRPLCHTAHCTSHNLHVLKSSIQKVSGIVEIRGFICRHEELRGRVDSRERGTFGIPGRIDGRIT
jgi:hypothetical protein